MGLVRPSDFTLAASTDAQNAAWFALDELPPLAFDHAAIVEKALTRLRAKLTYEPIGLNLLDEKFPFGVVERLYAAVLAKDFDRRNVRKKFLRFNILTELPEKRVAEKGRPGTLYTFDRVRYEALQREGFVFEIK